MTCYRLSRNTRSFRLYHSFRSFLFLSALLVSCALMSSVSAAEEASSPMTVRCAVVGGLNEIDFWPQLADRFQRATGHRLEFVAIGPKHAIAASLISGEADVILRHSSDMMINL